MALHSLLGFRQNPVRAVNKIRHSIDKHSDYACLICLVAGAGMLTQQLSVTDPDKVKILSVTVTSVWGLCSHTSVWFCGTYLLCTLPVDKRNLNCSSAFRALLCVC